ncbi:hypothetical protein [Flavobacterium anhuiense]|uniref:hypothetical protein n=1 Tax=Flavobacterium anhuiense TaxID=459526 RepID=UPI002026E78F|nr:hypothetical protein [Flavobacterium anhuiense]URM37168.1 hypothetical protein LLY39_00825 [Flavobacterium anhuiense]
MNTNYYFCSQAVVDILKPEEVSKPFISGFEFEGDTPHYIAWLDGDEIEKEFNKLDDDEQDDFWYWEIVPGNIDISTVDLNQAKERGLLWEIQHRTGMTKTCNQAYCICNIADNEGVTPIELIDKYL